jgi:general stress protein YciG
MKIEVKKIETPAQKIKVSFKEAGRRGGLAKVPKGFSKMDKDRLREIGRKAAEKRWSKIDI